MKRKSFLVMMSIAGLTLSAMFTACSSANDVEESPNVVYNEEGKEGVMPEFVTLSCWTKNLQMRKHSED